LECLKYEHENGCLWDWKTTAYAAKNGHLECLRYAHENGCELNEWTPTYAAQNGHLECFKYCFERWNEPQEFWNFNFDLSKIINKIDIDDPVWRRLFTIDLSKHPELKVKVENKKKEIEDMKQVSKASLENKLPLDIIKFILQPYF
jgi:hypothetical protein